MQILLRKYSHILSFFVVLSFFFVATELFAQQRVKTYEDYIDRYGDLAINHMERYEIPASITLAQGILESGAGLSDLARRSNNHFGIKCHRGWNGPSVYAADDSPNDCFRRYDQVEDSYQDHSEFLVNGGRYRTLFELSITDYKGWARGLQKLGYATDRAYANKLIKLIEDYELYRFDDKKYRRGVSRGERQSQRTRETAQVTWTHQPYITHDLVYVIAVSGDSFASIAREFGFSEKELLKYNEVPEDFPLSEGDIVYFQKKKARADKPYEYHTVQVGESMYSISQKYGIRLRNLYRLSKKSYEYVPEEGDRLKLR
ncbi:MAG: N-acetylmuramoyl-L-alanine amidase [Bacteroidetes bacterium GWD2_45_23]|nr:MAG: N-acetylmuramoyl-L-alanine amidase [Bacteroidetes bacterium GWC2_46_850]OFX71056.1 MAG: N-acetylmuramoyl-L-alanine amidase [Bacteroidetes bacterium GWC1_47_7]OFX85545.1 MAG: N-acetylmuramoyl-L-alanine amidase [Bacteroidetes bacterium GWD2_45_23]HAR37602.1 N-acetylmuramoyl-L-alanine amidase [Porphyromonadaceae bacterium]HBB00773.1 N-acetylmuramoyl-L-alanine amidase [Porphyromonadaceae bacterium]